MENERENNEAQDPKNHPNRERRTEIMSNLFKQGNKLIKEGQMTGDESVMSVGKVMVLLAGMVNLEDKMKSFIHHTNMFTSNEVMEDLMSDPVIGPLIMMRGGGSDKAGEMIEQMLRESKGGPKGPADSE